MDFGFSSEQQLLADSARRYITEQYSFDRRKQILASAASCSRDVWKDFAELGFLGLNVPEADGGLGGGPVETLLLATAIGEGLVVEPYLSSAVLATRAIARLGSDAQRAAWLPKLAEGELIAVVAADASYGLGGGDAVRASVSGDGWQLDGRVPVVYHAPVADLLLVAARLGPSAGAPNALFAVPARTAGVVLNPYVTVDAQLAADLECRAVRVDAASRLGADVETGLAAVIDYGLFALCAEALGALDRCLAVTVEYTRTRNQFGGPIGRFQALQHRMVDMLMHVEQARSMSYLAAVRISTKDAALRARDLSAAKVVVGQACRFVGQQAVQLHGGMGMTDEFHVSHYFKRLAILELSLGDTAHHLQNFVRKSTGTEGT
jgi:alkylation response protein AidB-like acyl-CoA dehydrogenase